MAKILMVASDPVEREILGLVIEFRGHTCATTGALGQAAGLLRKGFFDLVVAEIKSVAGEAQLIGDLKAAYPGIGFVILSETGETVPMADQTVPVPSTAAKIISGIDHALGKLIGLRAKVKKERRRFVRSRLELPCSIRSARSAAAPVEGRTVDLSRGGVYLVASGEWKTGMPVECVIHLLSRTLNGGSQGIRAEGKLTRVLPDARGGTGLGIAIDRHEFVTL